MPFSSGVYTLPNPALVTGEVVSATENNTTRNDIAGAFNLTMLRNGTSTATANLPMGGYKLTGLGVATTSGDALSYGAAAVVTTLTSTSLTATRVPYAGTGGLLQDASTFTFDGTTLTAGGFTTSGAITVSGGTANGVAYLNGSKVLTTGSALTFDGTNLGIGTISPAYPLHVYGNIASASFGSAGTVFVTRANNTSASPTAASGVVGRYQVLGYDGSTYQSVGQIVVGADGTVSNTNAAGYMAFNTTHTGTVTSTERMRIDSSGNLLVGTTNAGSAGISIQQSYNYTVAEGANSSLFNLFRQTSNGATVLANGYKQSTNANAFASSYGSSWAKTAISLNGGTIRFYTDTAATTSVGTDVTPTERMRIDSSGNLLVGTTSAITTGSKGFQASQDGTGGYIRLGTSIGTSYTCAAFVNTNGTVGSIVMNGTATSYVTSSDYRLKENIKPMQNALATVSQLNPVTYTWKADGSDGQGFIAHELQAVVPDCVTGEKDAVDEEGKPVYQGIDTSFLVATLTKAIQELKAELDATKAEVAALKGV